MTVRARSVDLLTISHCKVIPTTSVRRRGISVPRFTISIQPAQAGIKRAQKLRPTRIRDRFMRKIKLLFVALLVASVAFMMTACGGGDDARKALEGTTWKGYYGGYKGNVVKFKSEGKAVVKEFEHEGESDYWENTALFKYTYSNHKGKLTYEGETVEFEIEGDTLMTVYTKEGPRELKRQD